MNVKFCNKKVEFNDTFFIITYKNYFYRQYLITSIYKKEMSFKMQNLQVLIIDDHKTMLKIITNLLNQIGISNIEEATDGQAALQKLGQKKYDLIISDWNMMPMTGLELVQNIRGNPQYQHQNAPFIMVTAESKPENVMEAAKAGVNNYIVKPFSADTMEQKIKATLEKFKMI